MAALSQSETDSAAGDGPADGGLRLGPILAVLLFVLGASLLAIVQPSHPRPQAERSVIERLLYPVEVNAGLRLPSLPGSIHSVRFAENGLRGWAAGAGGLILASADGGGSWQVRQTGTAATLYGLHFAADGRRGWAVGERGAILRTQDGGDTWTLQRAQGQPRLVSVVFNADGRIGWIAGHDGTLLKSDDGGETWFAPAPSIMGTTRSIAIDWTAGRGVVLTSRQNEYPSIALVASERTRGGTTGGGTAGGTGGGPVNLPNGSDGGRVSVPTRGGPLQLESTAGASPGGSPGTGSPGGSPGTGSSLGTPGSGGSMGTSGTGTQSRTGGSDTDMGGGAGGSGTEVGTGGGSVGTGAGSDDGALRPGNTDVGGLGSGNTDVGGVDGPAPPRHFRELYFDPASRRFWAFGPGGALAVSADGGANWQTRSIDERVDLADVRFAGDGEHGWAVGSRGAIFSTDDRGATWVRRASGTWAGLQSVHSTVSGDRVWAAGEDGTLIASADGGESWKALSSGSETVLHDVELNADARRAWAVGGTGLILTSDDGGASWQSRPSGTRETLRGVSFDATGNLGLAVGDGGTILASQDGGRSWTTRSSGAETDFLDVAVLPGGRAFIAARTAGQLLSRDGLVTPDTLPARTVRFSDDESRGFALGPTALQTTRDLGESWANQVIPSDYLDKLVAGDLGPDSSSLLLAGAGGLVLTARPMSGERGATGTDADLNALELAGGGRLAWAAGEGGTIIVSRDAGESWAFADSRTASARRAIRFSSDGRIGVAVGHAPSLLRTADGGSNWSSSAWPLQYERYPAPWFWLAILLALAPLLLALRPERIEEEQGAAAIGASDKPTEDFTRDRLQFGPLAMGISRFLRNSRTEPPLTVAISGNWGSGKSSLMHLICTDLRRYGYRPVWFNAWHHQSDEQLLASLLNAIRDQGLPPLSSVDGWVFRFQLLWLRSKKNYVISLAAVAVAAAAAAFLLSGSADAAAWTRIGQSIAAVFGGGSKSAGADDAATPVSFLGVFIALFAAYRATRAFGLDPAVLLSSSFNSFRLKDASAQTSFRDRFAGEFGDVTEALPYRMVIVIDDLDRCRPETVLTVMESVNFLVSAGPCFVLFGMARERVLAGLSLMFHSIAKELIELDVALAADATEVERERAEREARYRYATDYLEKLINIDIRVPDREDIAPQVLLESDASQVRTPVGRIMRHAWPSLLVLAAAALGYLTPAWLDYSGPTQAPAVETAAANKATRPARTVTENTRLDPSNPPSAGPAEPIDQIQAPLRSASIQPGEQAAAWWYFLPALGIFSLGLAAALRYRSRRERREVKDSTAFRTALSIWLPVIQQKRPSPRRIKRFGNFIRYLAMLQQADPPPDPPLLPRIPFRRSRPAAEPAPAPPPKQVVEEHRLVALAALYDAYEGHWLENLWPKGSEPLDFAVRKAIAEVEGNANWPPSAEELESFGEAIRGIRLAGAVRVVRWRPAVRGETLPLRDDEIEGMPTEAVESPAPDFEEIDSRLDQPRGQATRPRKK